MNKKIVFAFVLLCCTLLVPLTAMQAVEAYRFKPVRVMLHSPAPDKRPVRRERAIELEQKRSECSKTFIMPDQTQVVRAYPYAIHVKDRDGKWVDKESERPVSNHFLHQMFVSPLTPLSLCLYASGSSFTESGVKTGNKMTLYHYTENEVTYASSTYVRYPDLSDLIPPNGSVTDAWIVTQHEDPQAQPFYVEAHAITSSWDPRTVTSGSLPTVDPTVAGYATWTLTPNSSRQDRSIAITSLAQNWQQQNQSAFGVYLTMPDPVGSSYGVREVDLPVLLVKYTVYGTPSSPTVGGSYYSDEITPPVLIPGRSVLVEKVGDVDNDIIAFSIQKQPIQNIAPYCQKPGGGDVYLPEPYPPYDFDQPVIASKNLTTFYSEALFSSYQFPPLNGDLYQNNALSAYLPEDDPAPVGLTLSVPGSTSYPFLHYTGDSGLNHERVDISALISTPVSHDQYPNISTENYILVLEPDLVHHPALGYIQAPLSELPQVLSYPLPDQGKEGEKVLVQDKMKNTQPLPHGLSFVVNPKPGTVEVILRPDLGFDNGTVGCVQAKALLSYNGIEAGQYVPQDPVPPVGIGWRFMGDDQIIIPSPVLPFPKDESVLYRSPSGSMVRFYAKYGQDGSLSSEYGSPTSTDWVLRYDLASPVEYRFQLSSKTGDLTKYYHGTDGYLRKVTSAQGGELLFERDSVDTSLLNAVVKDNLRMEMVYDPYKRLIAIREKIGGIIGKTATMEYDASYHLTKVVYPDINHYHAFEYDINDQIIKAYDETTVIETVGYVDASNPAVSTIENACGETTYYSRNASEHTASVTDAENQTTGYSYYQDGTLESVTDASGQVKLYFPDSEHASTDIKIIRSCASSGSQEQSFEYDSFRNLISMKDVDENEITLEYNENNKPVSVTDREGNTTEYTYTEDGSQIASVTDAIGRTVTYSYDENQKLSSITAPYLDGTNRTTEYTYDVRGYLDTVTDSLDRETDFDYNEWGRLSQVTDDLGRTTAFTYNAMDQVTRIQYQTALGVKNVDIAYDTKDNIASVSDPAGHLTQFEYDSCGRLVESVDSLNRSTTYVYDDVGQLLSVTDPLNHTASATYNNLGQVATLTDALNKTTSYQYDSHNRLYRVTNPLNQVTELTYDNRNRLTSVQDPINGTVSATYSLESCVTSVTDQLNHTYNLIYNDAYQLTQMTGPLQSEMSYAYYPFGGVHTITNALDQVIEYEYDSELRLTSVTDIQSRVTELTYDDADRVTEVLLPGNRTLQYFYDAFGNLTKTKDPLLNETNREYDISGNMTAFINEMGKRYEFEYDALDRLVKSIDPLDHERSYTYDETGNLSTFTDPLQHVTEWLYDARDQLSESVDPLDQSTLFGRDDLGRLTTLTDPLDREHGYGYDNLNRLTSRTTPLNHTTQYAYNAGSLLTSRTRPATAVTSASVTSYEYDSLDRLTQVTNPLQQVTGFTYNLLSQLTEVEFPDQSTVSYTYDTYNRLSEINASDSRSIEYTYDTLDRVTEIAHSQTGSYTYTYDALDRVTQETSPASVATVYEYDAASRLTEQTWNSESTTFEYDDASRLVEINAPGSRLYGMSYDISDRLTKEQLPTNVSVDYLYDADDRLTSLVYSVPGGSSVPFGKTGTDLLYEDSETIQKHSAGSGSLSSSSFYPSDYLRSMKAGSPNTNPPAGASPFVSIGVFSAIMLGWMLKQGENAQLKEQTDGQWKGKSWQGMVDTANWLRKMLLTPITIASFTPTWDAGNRMTQEVVVLPGQDQTRTYTYDDEDQLLTASILNRSEAYTYDERHNRLTKRIQAAGSDTTDTYTMNIGDQLTDRVKKHTQSQVVIEEEEFTYSDNGHMTSRVLTIGGNDYTTSYQYDVGGNLKQVTLPDSSTVTYQYDAYGNRVKKQTSTEKVSYEYAGGSCQREIHRNLSDTILYTLRYYPWGFTKTVPGTPDVTTAYYYLVDTRGWVWGLTDSDGVILETYQYSPYGELLSTPTITHSRFLSGADECLWDSETGLYYLHARYYDPQLGRFLQEDIVEGDLESPASQNRYTYCQNDPVSLVDPSGYSPQNTNTPSRFGQFNIANLDSPYGCSLSDLQPMLPEMKVLKAEDVNVIPIQNQYETCGRDDGPMMGDYDSCGKIRPSRPSDSEMETVVGTEDCGNYTITYGYDQYGNPIAKVTAKSGGSKSIAEDIEKGINEALWDLKQDGFFDLNNINISPTEAMAEKKARFQTLMKDMSSFMAKHWGEIAKMNSDFKDPYTAFYHSTRGTAVEMTMGDINDMIDGEIREKQFKDLNKNFTEKELKISIGMAVSYNDKKYNTNMGFYSSTDIDGNLTFGLVTMANYILATIAWESSFDPNLVSGTNDFGIMQINIPGVDSETARKIAEQRGLFNQVINVFYGTAEMFHKLDTRSYWQHERRNASPSQYEWMQANYRYQGAGVNRDKIWIELIRLSNVPWLHDYDEEKAKKDHYLGT